MSRGHSGRIEVGPGKRYLASLRATWRAAYESACKHDGIDPAAEFAVFSDNNPYRQFVDRAAMEFFEGVRQYQAGGYVGLQMKGDKAFAVASKAVHNKKQTQQERK